MPAAMPTGSTIPSHKEILDIGGSVMCDGILDRLKEALLNHKPDNQKPLVLPDELLYDDVGLDIWARIIFTPEFYQTRDEIELFERNSAEIAKHIPLGSVMVDLGAGDLRKVGRLLSVLEKRGDKTTYLALDISHKSLRTNLDELAPKHANVTCSGLWGDFLGGLDWVDNLDPAKPRVFLSLGSVLFNNATATAVSDLKKWTALMRPQDLILAGMDGHSIREHHDKVWAAYHAHDDLYAEFWANGFAHANALLGEEWLRPDDWETCGEFDESEGRHRFFFRAKGDVELGTSGKVLAAGQEIEWFDAHKHDEMEVRAMCALAGLAVVKVWKMPGSEMTQYLLKRKDGRENSPSDVDSAISMV